jgi:NADH:ubiquinone oxidoreductase subunit C
MPENWTGHPLRKDYPLQGYSGVAGPGASPGTSPSGPSNDA